MPARGHSTAPVFDPANPRTLRRFFQDLEFLFERTATGGDAERISWVVRYLPIDVADLAEALPESEGDATYEEFKVALTQLYPGAGAIKSYFVRDAQSLALRRGTTPIASIAEMAEYHREFKAITASLIKAGVYSITERDRLFIEGISEPLRTQVRNRLQLKFPDQPADRPYDPDRVLSAAEYVLTGAMVNLPAAAAPVTQERPSAGARAADLKVEDLAPLLKLLAKSMVEQNGAGSNFQGANPAAMTSAQRAAAGGPIGGQNQYDYRANSGYCHYCGDAGCQVRFCRHAEEDIKEGRIARNGEGRIVLANGSFVPRNLPGLTMRDRVFEWYRRYPLAQGTAPAAPAAQMVLQVVPSAPIDVSTFQLSTDARIDQLERELYALRGRQAFDGVEINSRPPRILQRRPQAAQGPAPPVYPDTVGGDAARAVRAAREAAAAEAPVRDPPPHQPAPAAARAPPAPEPSREHPFAKARDATYAPPRVRNFGAPPVPPKDKDTAYKTQVPVYRASFAEDIFERSMKAPVLTLTPEELLSISPEVRAKYREAVTPKRVATDPRAQVEARAPGESHSPDDTRVMAMAACTTIDEVLEGYTDDPALFSCSGEPLLPEGVVVPDPYEVYLKRLEPGSDPDILTVAKESHALRSIVGLVDNKEFVEAIIDPGSQIVAMSEDVCHALRLAYDPTIVLNMQSANGDVDRSLGLVRNVPFAIADIVLYLQVHVIRHAAYDILLGRPFDVLTKSIVKNFTNEEQTLTIVCPNTGATATVPTIARGRARFRASDAGHPLGQPALA